MHQLRFLSMVVPVVRSKSVETAWQLVGIGFTDLSFKLSRISIKLVKILAEVIDSHVYWMKHDEYDVPFNHFRYFEKELHYIKVPYIVMQ